MLEPITYLIITNSPPKRIKSPQEIKYEYCEKFFFKPINCEFPDPELNKSLSYLLESQTSMNNYDISASGTANSSVTSKELSYEIKR